MRNNHESVVTYFVLVFLLSFPFWALSMISSRQLLPGLPISALGAFTPALATFILIHKKEKLLGVSRLVRQSCDPNRINNRNWYFAIIFVNPFIAVVAYWLMQAAGRSLPNPAPLTLAIFPMFALFFVAALGEEIGWSGYATERLLDTSNITSTGILIGIVWAVWHFIPLWQAHRSIEWIAWWSLGTISLRVIMVWIYSHCGRSVFAMALFHAISNLCWQLFPNNGSHYDPLVFGCITFGVAMLILVAQQFQSKRMTQAA